MGEAAVRVLLVEDDPVDAELVRRNLERASEIQSVELQSVEALGPALERLEAGGVDLVLLDLNLPDSGGLDTLVRLRDADGDVPVVVFTNANDLQLALEALEEGAQDFLVKDELVGPAPLVRSIRYAVERRRIAREKLASLGVLSAGVAMGFNHLVGSILDSADLAAHELNDTRRVGRVRRRLNEIRRAALRAGDIAGQLRDCAAAAPLAAHRIDLSRFVLEMADLIGTLAPGGVEIAYDLSSRPTAVRAGRLQLHQLLLALVTNSLEAVREGEGRITLSTGLVEVGDRQLRRGAGSPQARPGRYAALRIGDNGPGIPAEARERIFEPFFTTKAPGRGLGLAAAAGIARQLGGVIHVDSAPGKGANFNVFLPDPDAAGPPLAAAP